MKFRKEKTKISSMGTRAFWDALCCWSMGHRAGFFQAINGYRAFNPAAWDQNLWLEYSRRLSALELD